MGEADRIELLLGHRTGDYGGGRAGTRQADRKFERIERAMRSGDAGMAGHRVFRRKQLEQGQADVERRIGFVRIGDDLDRPVPYGLDRAGVADRDERRQGERGPVIPAFSQDLGPDSGGIAERNRERLGSGGRHRRRVYRKTRPSGIQSPHRAAGRSNSAASAG
jgi:hypothetical protein